MYVSEKGNVVESDGRSERGGRGEGRVYLYARARGDPRRQLGHRSVDDRRTPMSDATKIPSCVVSFAVEDPAGRRKVLYRVEIPASSAWEVRAVNLFTLPERRSM